MRPMAVHPGWRTDPETATGMRVGEAIGLTRADVDLAAGIVTIRQAKFDRSTLVPLHPSVTDTLRAYASCRDRLCPASKSSTFFVASVGRALTYKGVHYAFTQLSPPPVCAPKPARRSSTAFTTASRSTP